MSFERTLTSSSRHLICYKACDAREGLGISRGSWLCSAPLARCGAAMPKKRRAAAVLLLTLHCLLLVDNAWGVTKAKEAMQKVGCSAQIIILVLLL